MFVDKPLPAPRREELKRKADEVRDEILRKADKDLLGVLKDRGIESFREGGMEPDEELGEDWVRFRPEKEETTETEPSAKKGKSPRPRI